MTSRLASHSNKKQQNTVQYSENFELLSQSSNNNNKWYELDSSWKLLTCQTPSNILRYRSKDSSQ